MTAHVAQLKVALAILRRKQVEERIGLSRSSIYKAVAEGTFPRPIRLSRHAVGWLESDIDAWLAARVAQTRAQG